MELYHNDMSSCAQKVRIVLFEKALQPTMHHVNLRAGEQNSSEYRRLNPNGVVPTLVDNGRVVVESAVIAEYLDDAYPQVPLRPAAPLDRALMRWWTMQPDAGFHQAVGFTSVAVAFRHQMLARGPEHARQLAAARPEPEKRAQMAALIEQGLSAPGVAAALKRYRRFIADMARQLASTTYLAGEQFSLADAMALPYVERLRHFGFEWWWREQPVQVCIDSWLKHCEARPGYRGISEFLDKDYLNLMRQRGAEVEVTVRTMLDAV
jgi:glutathione S-transferase